TGWQSGGAPRAADWRDRAPGANRTASLPVARPGAARATSRGHRPGKAAACATRAGSARLRRAHCRPCPPAARPGCRDMPLQDPPVRQAAI
ncbi:hypothetical protein PY02_00270, partial [Staphylococcus aureus]